MLDILLMITSEMWQNIH